MAPCVAPFGPGVAQKVENDHLPFPCRFAPKGLFDRHDPHKGRSALVVMPNRLCEGVEVFLHCASPMRSPTVHNFEVMPSAMAGVIRRDVWTFTKL